MINKYLITKIKEVNTLAGTLIRQDNYELVICDLPFFEAANLLCLHIWDTYNYHDFYFFCVDDRVVNINGTVEQIYQLVSDRIKLTDGNAVWYLRFVLKTCYSEEFSLVEEPDDFFWQPLVDSIPEWKERQEKIIAAMHPILVEEIFSGFHASVLAQHDRKLVELDIILSKDGSIGIKIAKVISDEIPGNATPKALRKLFKLFCHTSGDQQ